MPYGATHASAFQSWPKIQIRRSSANSVFARAATTTNIPDTDIRILTARQAVNGKFCGRLILDAFDFVDCGTHIIVIGRLKATYEGEGRPMTYSYYHEVIKGSAPKNAPTYREEPSIRNAIGGKTCL